MTVVKARQLSRIAAEIRITASRLTGKEEHRMAQECVLELADYLHMIHGDALFVPEEAENIDAGCVLVL